MNCNGIIHSVKGVGGVNCDLANNCDICDKTNMFVLKKRSVVMIYKIIKEFN